MPNKQGECWTMDFMSDSSRNQRRFRTFNVIGDFNRDALGIDIAVSLPAGRITRYLDKLAKYHGYPLKIRVDNGPEFTGKTFINWAKSHDITIDYIKPGSPYQNGYIVVKTKKGWIGIEVTSKTAPKGIQAAKEEDIRRGGGVFVRHPKTKALIKLSDDLSKIIRLE
ncbi:DDE-type integrase/transposase/recombinase [Gilliamella sp. Bif1-4]|uniref:DDE-type integrase/transposase/recombinase n=1 Tax=Gilliamella sp. Bif1-4 TaxID=3120233 RepID=UPI0011471E96|nr:DDE-type integrase/transposase/recombinase [Gilliamella apicola]